VIAGVIIGGVVTYLTTIRLEQRKARRSLMAAALRCLIRLLKIQDAQDRQDEKQKQDEIQLLGGDVDRYLDCIAASHREEYERHWLVCRDEMIRILLNKDLSRLDEAIRKLKSLCRVE
ncbi:MAG: hypothetical protein ACE5LX_04675, partial [Nitrospinota bacterium]